MEADGVCCRKDSSHSEVFPGPSFGCHVVVSNDVVWGLCAGFGGGLSFRFQRPSRFVSLDMAFRM